MPILNLYTRVLRLLGPQARLGWALAIANVALALAQFAEPVLLGRIIDSLASPKAEDPHSPGNICCRCSPPGSASDFS